MSDKESNPASLDAPDASTPAENGSRGVNRVPSVGSVSDIARRIDLFSKKIIRDLQKHVGKTSVKRCPSRKVALGFGWLGCARLRLGFRFHFWGFGIAFFSSHAYTSDYFSLYFPTIS